MQHRWQLVHPALLFALSLGLIGCGPKSEVKNIGGKSSPVQAEVMTLALTPQPQQFSVTGTVTPALEATLSTKVMGRVTAVHVREGDVVKSGQLLVSVDSRELVANTNIASATYNASVVGVGSARTAVQIEEKVSRARIAQSEAFAEQALAALAAAEARRDLALAGSRSQDINRAHIEVTQAESNLRLARIELDRVTQLVTAGAVARREQDTAQNKFDVAKGQYDAAVQDEELVRAGSRAEEIRAAEEAVAQAAATLKQTRSAVAQARAGALQVTLRKQDVDAARAQVKQASAAVQAAKVVMSYGQVAAPFDGRIARRLIDPGTMASPGTPLLTVEGGEFRLEVSVPESLISSLTVGTKLPVHIDAMGPKALAGTVVEVLPKGDAVSHSFTVKLALEGRPGLKSGQFGRAILRTGTTLGLEIPTPATWSRDGLNYVLSVGPDDIARLRIVTLGDSIDGKVEVLTGLQPGDRIVISDRKGITDGTPIRNQN